MDRKILFASIDQYHLSGYKDLQLIKYSKKGLINDYSQKMISSISCLHNKSSEFVDSNIQRNTKGMSSSNITATSYIYSLITIRSTSSDINQIHRQKGPFF